MKKTYTIKDYKLTLEVGDITEYDSDILINWVNIDLLTGPYPFNDLKEKAGHQFYYTLLPYKAYVKYTDAFTIVPGLLKTNVVVNCVIPVMPEMYNDCFFKVKETIKTYSAKNLSRYIALSIPDKRYITFILTNLFLYFKDLKNTREIKIFVKDKEEFDLVESHLSNFLKKKSIITFVNNLKWAFLNLLKK